LPSAETSIQPGKVAVGWNFNSAREGCRRLKLQFSPGRLPSAETSVQPGKVAATGSASTCMGGWQLLLRLACWLALPVLWILERVLRIRFRKENVIGGVMPLLRLAHWRVLPVLLTKKVLRRCLRVGWWWWTCSIDRLSENCIYNKKNALIYILWFRSDFVPTFAFPCLKWFLHVFSSPKVDILTFKKFCALLDGFLGSPRYSKSLYALNWKKWFG